MAQWEENDESYISKIKDLSVIVNDTNDSSSVIHQNDFSSVDTLQRNLGNCLRIIDDEVMKGYVTKLEQLQVVNYEEKNELSDVQLFKITELVYQEDEFSVHKLSTVLHSLNNRPCTVVLLLKGTKDHSDFYLGVKSLNRMFSTGRMRDMLANSLKGMFPGSQIEPYLYEDMQDDMMKLLNNEEMSSNSVSSVTCVADYKQTQDKMTNKEFIQGLEKFVESMKGKSYTAFFLADSLNYDTLSSIKSEYEKIYTQISPFANMQYSYSTNVSESNSHGTSEGTALNESYGQSSGLSMSLSNTDTEGNNKTFGKSSAQGVNVSSSESNGHTEGTSDGTNISTSDGTTEGTFNSVGVNVSVPVPKIGINGGLNAMHGKSKSTTHSETTGTSHSDTVSDTLTKTLGYGINKTETENTSEGTSTSKSYTEGVSKQNTSNFNYGESFNFVDTETLSNTFGLSQGITLNAENMMLVSTLDRLKKQLNRINDCESIGMWRFAAYFVAESAAESETAANTYNSIMSGTQTGIERSAVNTWSDDNQNTYMIKKYLTEFCHPKFVYNGFSYNGTREVIVNPTVLVSTNELAIHMGLPRHSVKGLPVVEHAVFAQEVLSKKKENINFIHVGEVFHLGQKTHTPVTLDTESLSMHTFITGSTGSGKSNTVYHILSKLRQKGIPFLVVEPAKGEYRHVFPNVNCFGTNPLMDNMLQINPFSFPKQVHVLEHIDRLVEIFNVCWPMYAAMPAVLKESIEMAYKSIGWDLDSSINTRVNGLFPSFEDVLRELNNTINSSSYSADTKGDYIGSLSTRIKSLTNGINGRIFVSNEMSLSDLFDKSAILDISRIGSMETKSLIMGLVVLKLQEYRSANALDMNSKLKHVTVLEEAHNILKKTSSEQSTDSANLQGKSVEMLSNTIAEIRTYGEGFIIVDQAPNLLDTSAIRNTNTKIVLRLPENNDREITGKSMALDDNQIIELSKLPTGVAAVYQNDWQEAILCQMPRFDYEVISKINEKVMNHISYTKEFHDDLLHDLLKPDIMSQGIVRQKILKSNVSSKIKVTLIENYGKKNLFYEWAVADYIKKNYIYSDVFKGIKKDSFNNLEELARMMMNNIEYQFMDFSEEEKNSILYYMCRIHHELSPKNKLIEVVRKKYLEGVMIK